MRKRCRCRCIPCLVIIEVVMFLLSILLTAVVAWQGRNSLIASERRHVEHIANVALQNVDNEKELMEAKKYIQLLKNNLDIQWFSKNSNSSDELKSYLDETQGIVVKEINGFTIIIKYDIDSMNSETEKFTINIFILILLITELVGLIIVRLLKRIILNPMAKEMRHIQSISEKDGMTELYNKYRLNSKICYYNSCSTLGVIFVDVNDLKKANDSYGHDVGNELICKVSNAMKNLQFSNLECYRVGGDEFVMVLPNCSKQKLKNVKKDFLENIEKITLKLAPIQVTVACGVSYQDKSIDIDRAIKLADQAMYRCKNSQKH